MSEESNIRRPVDWAKLLDIPTATIEQLAAYSVGLDPDCLLLSNKHVFGAEAAQLFDFPGEECLEVNRRIQIIVDNVSPHGELTPVVNAADRLRNLNNNSSLDSMRLSQEMRESLARIAHFRISDFARFARIKGWKIPDELRLFEPAGQHVAAPSKIAPNRQGAPPKWDWEGAMIELTILANGPDGLPARQAESERIVANWFRKKVDDEPSESEIRKHVGTLYQRLKNK
jgi:hypothetical protein